MQEAWQQAAENLEKVLSERDFATWIKPINFSLVEGTTVYLSVPTSFFKDWLEENYHKVIIGALSVASGHNLSIAFVVRDQNSESETVLPEDLIIKGHQEEADRQRAPSWIPPLAT